MVKLTPIDINHKSFTKKWMGYDADEVHQFLHQLASQMESLVHERNAMKDSLREKELIIHDLKERDQVLKSTITTATQMAERMRHEADREAKLIITDAHQKAEMVVRDSRDSLKKMHADLAELKRIRMQFEANLKALAQAHLSLIEQGERYMPSVALQSHHFENTGHQPAGATGVAGILTSP